LVLERVHILCFAVQETILSGLCTKAAWVYLQSQANPDRRTRLITALIIAVQLSVLAIDVLVVVLDYVEYYAVKAVIYSFTYALKLELEFAALNVLVAMSRLGWGNTLEIQIPFEHEQAIPEVTSVEASGDALDQSGRLIGLRCIGGSIKYAC
jgi:hypothetical protein